MSRIKGECIDKFTYVKKGIDNRYYVKFIHISGRVYPSGNFVVNADALDDIGKEKLNKHIRVTNTYLYKILYNE